MVRIILFVLKCLVGVLATVGLLLVGLVGLGVYFAETGVDPRPGREIAADTVLVLDLAEGVTEAPPHDSLRAFGFSREISLRSAVEALERASQDDRVKAVVAKLGRGTLSWTQAQELRAAVALFNASGKPSFAFAESYGEGGPAMAHYYLAAAFGEIWAQPSASFPLLGFSVEQPYLREALADAGVSAQVIRREEYKSAMDFLVESEMPTPVRINLRRLLDGRMNQFLNDVAADRTVASRRIRELVDAGPFKASEALAENLVDKLGYWDEVADQVDVVSGEAAEWIGPEAYVAALGERAPEGAPRVAMIHGLGPVVLGQADGGAFDDVVMASDVLADAFAAAREDGDIAAIIFRIDSPGGSYVASDAIWREVRLASGAGIPVVVSMAGVAASGGYFVAAPADKIVANSGTVTGSIGVITGKLSVRELLDDWDINIDGPQVGTNADFWSPTRPFTEEQLARLEELTEESYQDFLAKVAAGRGMSEEQVRAVAGGRIWTGVDARDAGLVDELGGLSTALDVARAEAGLSPGAAVELVPFPEPGDPFRALAEEFFGGGLPGLTQALRGLSVLLESAEPLIRALEAEERAGAPQLRLDGPAEDLY